MTIISTGEPSTLKTYKRLTQIFGPKAVEFIQNKIDESPNGEEEEVIAHETQMMVLLAHIGGLP